MIVWSALGCFLAGFAIRILRYWYLLRSFRLSIIAISSAVFFSTAITILVGAPLAGESIKWVLLGFVFSPFLLPSLLTILYIRFFDFLVIGIFLWLFHAAVPTLLPWVGVSIAICVVVLITLIIFPLLLKQVASFLLKYWHHPYSKKFLDKTMAGKQQSQSLGFARLDTTIVTLGLTGLVWFFESAAIYSLLQQARIEHIQTGVVQALARHIINAIPGMGVGYKDIAIAIGQFEYETFEFPIFICAIVCAIISINRWVKQKRV